VAPFILRDVAVVHADYFTDPACPWSWALEPALRKLEQELGESLTIAPVMGGLAREFGDANSMVGDLLAAGERSGMPVDPRLWLEARPRSSYPACIAVKAAAEQANVGPYLRRLREGLMCRRRKLDTTEALLEEARAVPGIDIERMRVDLGSHAILEAFGADLDRAGAVAEEHRAPESERVKLPSLEFRDERGAVHGVYGYPDYGVLRSAAIEAGARPSSAPSPSIEEALARYGPLATAEVAAVCDLPGPRAPAELWRLATEWRVKPERAGSGELWSLA
jgi:predicted DsbA family dithiol-disulfide isomerase